jgi:hypothetical protein
MRGAGVIVLAATLGTLAPVTVAAHHGGTAFDVGKEVVIKGTVKEWIFSNPHCLLMLDVPGENGQDLQWVAEGQAPNVIFPVGYRKDSFKPGDVVTITVEPAKNGRTMGRILKAVLADGRTLDRASSSGSPPVSGGVTARP